MNPAYEAKPLISIIINCYNGQAYLKDALDSIISQTYSNWEVVFWDNQSTDQSGNIFKQYEDPRFNYYYAPLHTKLGEARNLAFSKARGEWVAFLDCDDIWLPEKLQSQIDLIISGGADLGLIYGQVLVLHSYQDSHSGWNRRMRKYSSDTLLRKLPEGNVFHKLLLINFIPLVSAMFKASLYRDLGGVDPTFQMAEDYELFVKIAKAYDVLAVQNVVAFYRVHENNASINKLDLGFLENKKIISKYLPDGCAKKALNFHSLCYSIQSFSMDNIFYGIRNILFHLSIFNIIQLVKIRVLKKV